MRALLPLAVGSASSSPSPFLFSQPQTPPRLRYAVLGAGFAGLGAGFAGLSVAYHLLKQSPKDSNLRIDVFDEVGIGGGASGVSGGLLHPYSPKAKLLWRAAECWDEAMRLLNVAEAAVPHAAPIVRRKMRRMAWPVAKLKPLTRMLPKILYRASVHLLILVFICLKLLMSILSATSRHSS